MVSFAGSMCLFLFLFPLLWETDPKKCIAIYVRVFCLFSSRSFVVPGVAFRSLISFEFILHIMLENVLISLFTCSYPVFPCLLVEKTVFFPLYTLASFVID